MRTYMLMVMLMRNWRNKCFNGTADILFEKCVIRWMRLDRHHHHHHLRSPIDVLDIHHHLLSSIDVLDIHHYLLSIYASSPSAFIDRCSRRRPRSPESTAGSAREACHAARTCGASWSSRSGSRCLQQVASNSNHYILQSMRLVQLPQQSIAKRPPDRSSTAPGTRTEALWWALERVRFM